ncbi:hypothetical protein BDP27DRAFT_1335377 [Rhodocollybia butyracea]|uniref:Uncharacterized protein n=1 Tax=Rhodocollybia butyracea TaxID=206335 RepID=A0A9P5U2A8_9AGAR|nr:hypothetical protein BDP27DRAFT_1335377 [Rhodocollybia butyracea]
MTSSGPSNVYYVTDIVRKQGEELLRVRKELEKTQELNVTTNNIFRIMQKQLENLQSNSVGWRSRFVKMQEDFTHLATENHSLFLDLQTTRAALQDAVIHTPSVDMFPQNGDKSSRSVSPECTVPETASEEDRLSEISFDDLASAMTSGTLNKHDAPNGKPAKLEATTELLLEMAKSPPAVATTSQNAIAISPSLPITKQPLTLDSPPAMTNTLPRRLSITSHSNPVCSTLPDPNDAKKLCQKTFDTMGQQSTVYHILKTPQAMLAIPNSTDHAFYTVFSTNAMGTTVGVFTLGWEGHLLIYSGATLSLYYLGEYAGGAGHKVTYNEYKTLPEETQMYILDSAKLLDIDLWTKADLMESMSGKKDSVYVVKMNLKQIKYNLDVERLLREAARNKEYI